MPKGERNLMLLFLLLSLGATVLALGFQLPEAQLFPLITGALTSALVVLYFVITAVPRLRSVMRPYIEDDIFMKITAAADALEESEAEEASERTHEPFGLPPDERRRRELSVIGFVVGFGLLALVVGLTLAAPVFMLAVMLAYSKESWKVAVAVAAGTSLFIYLVFSVVLQLPPHLGLLRGLM